MICGSWVSPKTDAMWQANMAETIFICTCFKLTYSSSGRWFWLASLGFLRVALRSSKTAGWTPPPLFGWFSPEFQQQSMAISPHIFPLKASLESPMDFPMDFPTDFPITGLVGTPPGRPNFAKALWPTRTRTFGQAPCTCSRRYGKIEECHGKILESSMKVFLCENQWTSSFQEMGNFPWIFNIPLSCWISEG